MTDTGFYLYFPRRRDADVVAECLRARGFEVTVRGGADEVNWLALARGDVAEHAFDEAERAMFELAADHGGEYDGYERAVDRRPRHE